MTISLDKNIYKPIEAVWELTFACNMRCKHCGSSCGAPLPSEMTISKSLDLCNELIEIGVKKITLSGGEPFLYDGWDQIARKLSDNNIKTHIISNGWLFDNKLLDAIIETGIQCVGLSIDGCKDSHDFIRKSGSYLKAINALKLMNKRGFPTTCITSVNKINIIDLPILKNILIECGVGCWQIQLAMPMGNLLLNKELILTPQDISTVIDFCYFTAQEQKIAIAIGDNLGYHSNKHNTILRCFNECNGAKPINDDCSWQGCSAGKNIFGIRADGKIYGCLAIRYEQFCAGSACETTLSDIWNNAKKFEWNRTLKKKDLVGFCQKCIHGDTCLGGCSAQKLSFGGSIYADNHNCAYRLEIEAIAKDIVHITEVNCLIDRAKEYIAIKNYQVAEIYIAKALSLSTNNFYLLNLAGFVNFFLKNYELSLKFNESILEINPTQANALRGKGMCLCKLGLIDEGISIMYKSIDLADKSEFDDICYDSVVMLMEANKPSDAYELVKVAKKKSPSFAALCKSRSLE